MCSTLIVVGISFVKDFLIIGIGDNKLLEIASDNFVLA
jgi:hypothetical protein